MCQSVSVCLREPCIYMCPGSTIHASHYQSFNFSKKKNTWFVHTVHHLIPLPWLSGIITFSYGNFKLNIPRGVIKLEWRSLTRTLSLGTFMSLMRTLLPVNQTWLFGCLHSPAEYNELKYSFCRLRAEDELALALMKDACVIGVCPLVRARRQKKWINYF